MNNEKCRFFLYKNTFIIHFALFIIHYNSRADAFFAQIGNSDLSWRDGSLLFMEYERFLVFERSFLGRLPVSDLSSDF